MLDGFDNVVWTVSLAGVEDFTGGEAGGARPTRAEPIRGKVRNDHDRRRPYDRLREWEDDDNDHRPQNSSLNRLIPGLRRNQQRS